MEEIIEGNEETGTCVSVLSSQNEALLCFIHELYFCFSASVRSETFFKDQPHLVTYS